MKMIVKDPKMTCAFFMFIAFVGFALMFGTSLVAEEMVANETGEVDRTAVDKTRQAGAWMVFIGGAVVALCMVPKFMKSSERSMIEARQFFGQRRR